VALEAVRGAVDAALRSLSRHTGLGRETVRVALHRLAVDGWITLDVEAAGTHAATWKIDPTSAIHRDLEEARTQVRPPPTGDTSTAANLIGAGHRAALLATLRNRQAQLRHDVLTHRRFSILTGNVYARICESPTLQALHDHFGQAAVKCVEVLKEFDMVEQSEAGLRHHVDPEVLQRAAEVLGVTGALDERAERYRLEQVMHGWWLGELEWLRTPRDLKRGRRKVRAAQRWLVPPTVADVRNFQYPRTPDGTPSHRAAAQFLAGEVRPTPITALQSAIALLETTFGRLEEVA